MSAEFHVEKLVLQGDAYAEGFTIHGLDLTGLGLTKSSVGLGNVDNTTDLLKPLSNATVSALALKEDAIPEGTTDQFLIGDKTWLDFGALALQNGATTLPLLSVIGASASSNATLVARRNDSNARVYLEQIGASVFGNILTGIPAANVGSIVFENDAYGVIKTNNSSPIVFGTNSFPRAQIGLGLYVGAGAIADPGAGCILATGTITAAQLVGGGAGITGLVKNQIPATLNATVVPRLTISGVGGAGYVDMFTQTSNPATSFAHIFAKAGKVALGHSGSTVNAISFDNFQMTADRTLTMVDASGVVPVIVSAPANAGATGKIGSVAFDATHIYYCYSVNTWIRATMASW